MSVLDVLLEGRTPQEQIDLIEAMQYAIPEAKVRAATQRILSLVPGATGMKWSGDVAQNDDGTTTPYVSFLTILVGDDSPIELPVENDLGCGLDWYDSIHLFFHSEADEDAFNTLLDQRPQSGDAIEAFALDQIGRWLGGDANHAKTVIGAMTLIAEMDPFGEAHTFADAG